MIKFIQFYSFVLISYDYSESINQSIKFKAVKKLQFKRQLSLIHLKNRFITKITNQMYSPRQAPYPQSSPLPNPQSYQPTNAQRYIYVDPGRQSYINPAFIPPNQNYYTSPIISNSPVPNPASTYGMQDPYANYYNYYNNHYQQGNCGCAGQYNGYQNYPGYQGCYPCAAGYGGYGYTLPVYGAHQGYGCSNCPQYGLSINRDRITPPRFPSKLGHSFVTSGDQAQTRQVITEHTSQSAPFQTQRRKTYQPYTRKYIEYQDYVQFVPVQRSEWMYKKVMKQIDFVPQEYYETSVEVVPREKIEQRLMYVPVEKEFVHVPKDVLSPPAQQSEVRIVDRKVMGNTFQTAGQSSVVRPDAHFVSRSSNLPLQSSGVLRASNPPADRSSLQTIYEQKVNPSIVRPAESTVEMVPSFRLQSFNQQSSQKSASFGASIPQATYQFPTTGGVVIGSSSQAQSIKENPILSSFGPDRFENLPQAKPEVNIEASEVIRSAYEMHRFGQDTSVNPSQTQKEAIFGRNFRESGHVESEDLHFDPTEYRKKQSIVNRFEDDLN